MKAIFTRNITLNIENALDEETDTFVTCTEDFTRDEIIDVDLLDYDDNDETLSIYFETGEFSQNVPVDAITLV